MVKRVIGIWFKEQENKTHNDITNIEHGFPISSEDVQTNVAVSVNIRMVNRSVAMDNWSLVGILRRHSHGEIVFSSNPNTIRFILEVHGESENHNVSLVHSHFDERGLVKILHVLGKADLSWSASGCCGYPTGCSFRFFFLYSGSGGWGFLFAKHYFLVNYL